MKKQTYYGSNLNDLNPQRTLEEPAWHMGKESAGRYILGHALFIAAVNCAAEEGKLEPLSQNLKRLAVRPLLYKMIYCLGHNRGIYPVRVEKIMSELEIERLLEISCSPRDMFQLAYATGKVLHQHFEADIEENMTYRLLFSMYLHEASVLFDDYNKHIERMAKGVNLEKIMDKVTYH